MSIQAFFLSMLSIIILLTKPSTSATDTFVYGGCSPIKYNPGTPYEYNVNSILTSLVNSVSSTSYNNFKISLPGSTKNDIIYGLYQCRGDLSNSDCRDCVAHAVSRLGVVCPGSSGGALQFDGCFIKYDNITFFGVEDKGVVMKKCGPSIGFDSDGMTSRDSLLGYLTAGGQYFRVGGSGNVQGVAQCVQDLSMSQCQDCLAEATVQLKSQCGSAAWGDMFLGKCYARYSSRGDHSRSHGKPSFHHHREHHSRSHDCHDNDDDDDEMPLAILIGLIAGVASLVVVFLTCLAKLCDRKGGGK